jgi:hypothetical protein
VKFFIGEHTGSAMGNLGMAPFVLDLIFPWMLPFNTSIQMKSHVPVLLSPRVSGM